MIRIGTIVWFVVLALLGVGLFQVKYAVQAKERDLRAVNRQITADRQILRVLEAEWSFLNDPVRLADLTRRHTDLAPAMANQIARFDNLRERPAALPAPEAPLLAGSEAPLAVTPAAAVETASMPAAAPVEAPMGGEESATFQTSSGQSADPAEPVDEDATIRAILADMEAKQNGTDTASPIQNAPDTGGAGAE
jgi:hypothetical protein